MKIIAFVGLPASGKSEASKIALKMGLRVVVMGDVIREEVKKRDLLPTDENSGIVANDLRKKEGMDAIAKRCIPCIKRKSRNTDVIIVDGIRGIAEVSKFKEVFSEDFKLIKVDTPIEKRFLRVKERVRSDRLNSLEKLKMRDERELSWGMKEAMDMADMVIENEDSLKKFQDRVKETLEELERSL